MSSVYMYVPETILLRNLVTNQPLAAVNSQTKESEPVVISFYAFLVSTLLKDSCFGANAMTVMHAIDIKEAVQAADEGTYVEIDREAWQLLETAVNSPSAIFNTEIVMQLGPFLKAVLETFNEKPKLSEE